MEQNFFVLDECVLVKKLLIDKSDVDTLIISRLKTWYYNTKNNATITIHMCLQPQ
ncbi:hypothetical protein PIROE2DRAFT_15917 [Piromyces sp. E2]|nr:hypothetical protein PIROE2DRAFT_15917 [Piromyces sp. E2]|eukprot:OUM58740.1 hypothetical protein PIROE2DRAFT_15917 [Piromyces sp. E2]